MAEKKPTIRVDPRKKCKVNITLYVDRDEINARKNLEQCKVTIVQTKPTSTNFDYVDRVLHPSNQKDWQLIRYFSRVSQSVFLGGGNSLNRNLRKHFEENIVHDNFFRKS